MAGRLESPLLLYFLDAQNLCLAVSSHSRSVLLDAFSDELSEVLIGCHHKGVYALQVSLMSQRADDVVRLKPGNFEHGDVVSGQDVFDDGHGKPDGFGRLLALGFVLGVGLVSERAAVRVEGNAQMCWSFLRDDLFQRVDKTKDG